MMFLMRHGEVIGDGEKRFVGWTDVPLSEEGIAQAKAWGRFFVRIPLTAAYCSDLARSRQTADIICAGRKVPVRAMAKLREINLGVLENVPMRAFREQFPQKWRERGERIFSFEPEGGESFRMLLARVLPVYDEICAKAAESVLVVGHAGVNRALLCHLLGMPPQNLFRIGQDCACMNRIDCRNIPHRVVAMNCPPPADA